MSDPCVSVIVPVYNCAAYLRRCVDSILSQTESNLELILVNDGSTDGSGELCDRYAAGDCRIRVIHSANQGVSAARNAGINAARGEYLAFADGDDWLEPEMYARLLEAKRSSGCDLVFCGFRRELPSGSQADAFPRQKIFIGGEVRSFAEGLFRGRIFGAVWRGLYPREVLGHCRFREDICYAEDLLFNLEILKNAGSVAVIPDVLYHYNKANEASVSEQTRCNPDIRYTRSLQCLLEQNQHWRFPLEPDEFYRVYVDMMFQYLVRKLEQPGNEGLVEQYLTEGFFARCCRYDGRIPARRRIICILIRRRWFRLAVALRRAEDLILKLLRR